MLVSLHNHTNWSDGGCTLAAQIQAGREAGLAELGISDHYVLRPSGPPPEWSMDLDLLADYVTALCSAREEVRDLTLRVGIEADFFPETVGTLRERLASWPFDFVIGSVHRVEGLSFGAFNIDDYAEDWKGLSPAQVDEVWRCYWRRVCELAGSGTFDLLAHPDLPKKFGFRPQRMPWDEIDAAVDALATAGMSLEINTAGWSLPAGEAYPSLEILQRARARSIPLAINADAHFPEFLVRDFPRAWDLARAAGYTELVTYDRRRPVVYPLPG